MERFAIAGLVAMGLGVVVACGGALAPSEPSPPADSAAPENDPAGGGKTGSPNGLGAAVPGAGDPATSAAAIPSCATGFVDCDADPKNGCECPSDSCLRGGLCGKRVFVTSTITNGNLGGLAGADAKCQARALAAVPPLPGTYKAWLSDDTGSPSTRFTKAVIAYRLVSGALIANDWSDLTDGTLSNPIDLDESGAAAPTNEYCGAGEVSPWSWTSASGTALDSAWGGKVAGEHCANWTDASSPKFTEWGSGNRRTDWSSWCNGGSCAYLAPLFCFQQ